MKRRRTKAMAALAAAVGLLLAGGARAQSTDIAIPRIELKAGDKVPIANASGSMNAFGPIRCDSHGNVYMRPVSAKMDMLLSPVLRISGNGQNTKLFDVSNVPEVKDAAGFDINDFAVGRDGAIIELVGILSKEQVPFAAVIQMDAEDKSAFLVRIDSNLSPRQIAPLSSGMFLLSGLRRSSQVSGTQIRQSAKPITAIFDSQGKFVKEIQLPGDIKIPDVDSSKKEKPDTSALEAVDLSQLVVTDDGTVYMLRNGSPSKIYVISSIGEVIRTFQVVTPAKNVAASSIFYSSGQLAFGYFITDSRDESRMHLVIRILDAQDGHILWDYVLAKDVYGVPVCYNGQEFTLLSGMPDHRMGLLKVSPQ